MSDGRLTDDNFTDNLSVASKADRANVLVDLSGNVSIVKRQVSRNKPKETFNGFEKFRAIELRAVFS